MGGEERARWPFLLALLWAAGWAFVGLPCVLRAAKEPAVSEENGEGSSPLPSSTTASSSSCSPAEVEALAGENGIARVLFGRSRRKRRGNEGALFIPRITLGTTRGLEQVMGPAFADPVAQLAIIAMLASTEVLVALFDFFCAVAVGAIFRHAVRSAFLPTTTASFPAAAVAGLELALGSLDCAIVTYYLALRYAQHFAPSTYGAQARRQRLVGDDVWQGLINRPLLFLWSHGVIGAAEGPPGPRSFSLLVCTAQLGMFATAGFVHAVLFWWGEGGCAFPFTTRNFDSADGTLDFGRLLDLVFFGPFKEELGFRVVLLSVILNRLTTPSARALRECGHLESRSSRRHPVPKCHSSYRVLACLCSGAVFGLVHLINASTGKGRSETVYVASQAICGAIYGSFLAMRATLPRTRQVVLMRKEDEDKDGIEKDRSARAYKGTRNFWELVILHAVSNATSALLPMTEAPTMGPDEAPSLRRHLAVGLGALWKRGETVCGSSVMVSLQFLASVGFALTLLWVEMSRKK